MKHNTRANDFDVRMGVIQTEKSIYLGEGLSVLDVGCGVGEYTPMFLRGFKRVVGLDPNEKFLKIAREKNKRVEYIQGYGESFKLDEKFDTISMVNLLEHVDEPVKVLKNCRKHLNVDGRIVIQVPNCESVTRRLGVLMGIIDKLDYVSDEEKKIYGHKRAYNINRLEDDVEKAGLEIFDRGGILYKPLPNVMLEKLCLDNGEDWALIFIRALVTYGKSHPWDCGYLYVLCG